jgi:hypothetical protein
MTSTTPARPATRKQLAYLRALAAKTGQTFTPPRTSAEASREIQRLKQARPMTGAELEIEREIADAITHGNRDATRFRPSEVTGYGSNATWSQRA